MQATPAQGTPGPLHCKPFRTGPEVEQGSTRPLQTCPHASPVQGNPDPRNTPRLQYNPNSSGADQITRAEISKRNWVPNLRNVPGNPTGSGPCLR